jgi:hypothetical protein
MLFSSIRIMALFLHHGECARFFNFFSKNSADPTKNGHADLFQKLFEKQQNPHVHVLNGAYSADRDSRPDGSAGFQPARPVEYSSACPLLAILQLLHGASIAVLPACKRWNQEYALNVGTVCRLEICLPVRRTQPETGDTAGWKPALRGAAQTGGCPAVQAITLSGC